MNGLGNRRFEITTYHMQSDRVTQGLRIALLSDLHNHEYGSENYDLVEAIRQSRPDLILMVGDMVNQDDGDLHVVLSLCEALKRVAPVYYTMGNHEGVLMYDRADGGIPLDARLMEIGVAVPGVGREDAVICGNPVTLGVFPFQGAESEPLDMQQVEQFEQSGGFRIVISHYPSIFYETLYEVDAELAVAGHYHGGQVRLPFLGGLYHMDDGVLPRYSGGEYDLGKAKLIVTRGLGGHTWLPRINNRPELVMIEVEPSGHGQG